MNIETKDDLFANGKVMSLIGHLSELRVRLIKAILAILAGFCLTFFFSTELINFLKQPLVAALPNSSNILHFTGPLEVFMMSMKVSFFASIIFSCPIWIYQMWKFIEPALYVSERKYIIPFVISTVALFLFGILFSFYIIIPLTLKFLMSMGAEIGTPIITISDYVGLLVFMIMGMGLIFETPIILILLSSLGVINAELLAKHRRYIIVLILIIAAILTPPDPLSQIGMSIPLYLMYEFSIVIIRILERKKTSRSEGDAR